MSLAALSPALKHIRKYLIHAKQVEKVDLKMAYFCTFTMQRRVRPEYPVSSYETLS